MNGSDAIGGNVMLSYIHVYDPTSLDCNAGADPGFKKGGGGPTYLMSPNILACLK